MRNISSTEKFYKQKRCGSTISTSLYFYFLFIEKIISSFENRSLDNNFARSPERSEFFDPAPQLHSKYFFLFKKERVKLFFAQHQENNNNSEDSSALIVVVRRKSMLQYRRNVYDLAESLGPIIKRRSGVAVHAYYTGIKLYRIFIIGGEGEREREKTTII